MLKLLVLTQTFPVREQPYRGHSVLQTLLRLRQWADLRVISPQATYPSWLRPNTRTWSQTDLSYAPQSIHAKYFSYPAIPLLTRPLNGFVCARYAEAAALGEKPDAILSYWIYPDGFAAVRLGRKLAVPVIVKSIGSDLNETRDWISTRMVRRTMNVADAVLTVSNDLRRKAIAMGVSADKIIAIPNGCDTTIFALANRAESRRSLRITDNGIVILYVGRLDVKKGLRELVRAFAQLKSARSEARLIFVGDGPADKELTRLASELNVLDAFTIVPPCDSKDVARWMAASNLVTLPSYAEGCPNVVLEALSCGRPVVATSVGAIPDLVNESSGMLIPPRDADALATALLSAVNRDWDYAIIRATSRRSWDDVARETFDVCSAVVARRQGSVRAMDSAARAR
jgi:glycosyltransferase involved in cell wall biosynthesis